MFGKVKNLQTFSKANSTLILFYFNSNTHNMTPMCTRLSFLRKERIVLRSLRFCLFHKCANFQSYVVISDITTFNKVIF